MPRPKKFRNDLECPTCFKICKSESGLTRHCNSQHPYGPTGSAPISESSDVISIIPADISGVPPDIVHSQTLTSDQCFQKETSEDEGLYSQSYWEISGEPFDDLQYDPKDDATDDGSVTSDETIASFDIDNGESASHSILAQQHESLSHHSAGYIYEAQGTGSQVFEIQNSLRIKDGHPFSPWVNEDEFWLAYVMFVKAGIFLSACSDLLDGFRNGRISMRGGLSYNTTGKMLKLIDNAKFFTVLIYITLLYLYIRPIVSN